MKHRTLARWTAAVLGHFWLPCPLCGQEFGGHEWKSINGHANAIPGTASGHALGICPDCTAAGKGCYAEAAAPVWWITHGCEQVRQALRERLGEAKANKVLADVPEHRE